MTARIRTAASRGRRERRTAASFAYQKKGVEYNTQEWEDSTYWSMDPCHETCFTKIALNIVEKGGCLGERALWIMPSQSQYFEQTFPQDKPSPDN